jgi:peptidyl-prolyl cis-trans isomerase SurA
MTRPAPIRIGFACQLAVIRHSAVILSGAWRAFAPGGVEGPAVAFLRRQAAKSLLFALLFSAPATVAAQQPGPSSPVVLDRAVAVVNRHVILASDLDDEIRLSVLDPNSAGQGELTQQQALEQLIGRALIEQQIRQEDMPAIEPSQEEVNARLDELRKQLPVCVRQNCATGTGWNAFLKSHELTIERVEAYLRYRLEILSFIEQRFRQGIQISQEQIETYYNGTLRPQYAPGQSIPPLDQVAPRIQEILLEQQVNMLFDNWLNNLRQQGDVEVLDPGLAPKPAPALAPALETPAAGGGAGNGGL